jgi:hypothetical protein
MISEQVTTKIEKLAKAAKTPTKVNKTKAKVAPVATKAKKAAPVVVVVEPVAAAPAAEIAAPAPAVEPVAAIVEPVTPVAPAIPLSLRDQIFSDFGLRQATHRAALMTYLVEHIGEQVSFTTLAATAWANVTQKTNTTTSVSTSIKKLERRIVRNKLEDRYAIKREVIDGALTAGFYTI